MQYNKFCEEYINDFKNINYIFKNDHGFIVWRLGTGKNIELLHIKTFKKRQGIGKKLFIEMLKKLEINKPYYSIFGFTRVDNIEAQNFYVALGFNIEQVNGLYKDGKCKLFWQSYKKLKELHLE